MRGYSLEAEMPGMEVGQSTDVNFGGGNSARVLTLRQVS